MWPDEFTVTDLIISGPSYSRGESVSGSSRSLYSLVSTVFVKNGFGEKWKLGRKPYKLWPSVWYIFKKSRNPNFDMKTKSPTHHDDVYSPHNCGLKFKLITCILPWVFDFSILPFPHILFPGVISKIMTSSLPKSKARVVGLGEGDRDVGEILENRFIMGLCRVTSLFFLFYLK